MVTNYSTLLRLFFVGLIFAICLTPMHLFAAGQQVEFVVSLSGSDRNPGTIDKPFATLERARDAIRELKQKNTLPFGGAVVFIRGGTYHLSKTFELTEKDSGTEKSHTTYRSYKNAEVHITGGKELSGFSPVTDPSILKRIDPAARSKVLQVNLKTLGITDYGELKPRGMGKSGIPAALELFFNDAPMNLARWPNSGWVNISATAAGQSGGRFLYKGNRPNLWAQADDIWLHGYWTHDWADSYVKVAALNTITNEIVTQAPHGVYGYKAGARYYALNILEELDQPGEWYLDRSSGILYFWPPTSIKQSKTAVSILPTIISLRNTSHVTIQGMTIEQCRGTAITISGGTDNRIAGCTVRNVGNCAVKIDGGSNNGVQSCDISNCGEGGITLSGGDRKALVAAGNYAVNNRIHDFSQWGRTYNPGIAINGVGNHIAHNQIYNAPHTAILLHGNDHIIEYNDIHHVCMETSDAGAFYMGRDYTERGNILRYNYFHDLNMGDVNAIYLDDMASGTTVFANIVYKSGRGTLIGGGRDNIFNNNIFIDCKKSVSIDARAAGWGGKHLSSMTEKMVALNYRQPPYSIRYPELFNILERNQAMPEGNSLINNISVGGKWLEMKNGLTDKTVRIEGNFVDKDPGFVDRANSNFQLMADSPAFKLGFQQIPMEKIGLYKDEFRK